MADIKKDMRGYLYPNLNKTKPTQPDHTGKFVVENKEWRVSAWENTAPDGKKYLSLSISAPLPVDPNAPPVNKDKQTNVSSNEQSRSISDDLDDLEDILKSAGDDNPFN